MSANVWHELEHVLYSRTMHSLKAYVDRPILSYLCACDFILYECQHSGSCHFRFHSIRGEFAFIHSLLLFPSEGSALMKMCNVNRRHTLAERRRPNDTEQWAFTVLSWYIVCLRLRATFFAFHSVFSLDGERSVSPSYFPALFTIPPLREPYLPSENRSEF